MTKEFLIFEIGDKSFGVPLSLVEEVVLKDQITPIPKSPPFLLGLSAVRGKVLGVIDAAKRYGIASKNPSNYFMICRVRDNLTAVTIEHPVIAGEVPVRELKGPEAEAVYREIGVNPKFLKEPYELEEYTDDKKVSRTPTGKKFIVVDADLFVSHEMAIKVGEE